jgi:hypothetical protein
VILCSTLHLRRRVMQSPMLPLQARTGATVSARWVPTRRPRTRVAKRRERLQPTTSQPPLPARATSCENLSLRLESLPVSSSCLCPPLCSLSLPASMCTLSVAVACASSPLFLSLSRSLLFVCVCVGHTAERSLPLLLPHVLMNTSRQPSLRGSHSRMPPAGKPAATPILRWRPRRYRTGAPGSSASSGAGRSVAQEHRPRRGWRKEVVMITFHGSGRSGSQVRHHPQRHRHIHCWVHC